MSKIKSSSEEDKLESSSGKYELRAVFTPSSLPDKTFVERGEVGDRLERYLKMRGAPICLSGPYQSGKTTLVLAKAKKIFEDCIHITCKEISTFDELLFEALNELEPYHLKQRNSSASKNPFGISGGLFGFLRAQWESRGYKETNKEERVVEPRITSRALAKFSAAANRPLVLDDIQKLSSSELGKVANAMREWQTTGLDVGTPKFVVIGSDKVSFSIPDLLLQKAPDLHNRLVDFSLSLMTEDELHEIIRLGSSLLNVDFSSVANQIIEYSSKHPGICHHLCYHACSIAGVESTSDSRIRIGPDHLERALDEFLTSCSTAIKYAFKKIDENPVPLDGIPAAFNRTVLDKVASGGMEGISNKDLVSYVGVAHEIDETQVIGALDFLVDGETGVLIFDNDTGSIRFKDPMHFAYYRQRKAISSEEIKKKELASAFLEIFGK
uniref:AAA ATPase domain-containing protein n=1 Tax=Candidatus Kentrum sp. DK TaxID=2126562 RepID=A0A450SFI0_9GAMM|nr:MAG: hypothetical protein BECKDK2373C_GA0170839_103227 [Candidatus Kentron sp. DK]